MAFYFIKKYNRQDKTFPEIRIYELASLPIKKISPKAQAPFVKLVDKILALKKQGKDTAELENEIDRMVYDLYELTEAERQIVAGKA